jgi:N-acetylated-alpha-linked acidic dipeptidase
MPAGRSQGYDPVPPIPTYDEALATGATAEGTWHAPRSPVDGRSQNDTESQSLLASHASESSSRRPRGYRPPTVETDDEESGWESDGTDADDHVRQEMQELEIGEPSERSRSSIWAKRISFSSYLPQWRWSWRWRLPRLRIQLPSGPTDSDNTTTASSRLARVSDWFKENVRSVALIVARIFAVFLVMGFLYLIFMSDMFLSISKRRPLNPEDVRNWVQENIERARMRATVEILSNYSHVAGSAGDYGTMIDVYEMFRKAGLDDVAIDNYFVYLNYPRADGRAVEIIGEDGVTPVWTAKLEEDNVKGQDDHHELYAFHGHSKSGDVKGPLIYANYGSREDFKRLVDRGIDTSGAIALVRYYGTQTDRALKVKAAELAGFAGCLIYSDPADDGFLKGDVAPSGRYMPADGVQRGSVSLMSWVVGDVLTPGWESKPGLPRMPKEVTPGLVKIPSLPLAWRDAQVLLQRIKGFGERVPDQWVGGVPDVGEWWTGNLSSPIVRLKNEQDEVEQKEIWNVYGKIVGVEQGEKSILIGNHRDAWGVGATDPHTGTAILVEVVRVLGDLVGHGWRPLRTIEFMSWDAEEYNLIGSTEYVENNLESLRKNAWAYINLDTAVQGSQFRAAGSPMFRRSLLRVLSRVIDPNLNANLLDIWESRQNDLEGLGAGSDYVAFQDIAGVSSLDLSFSGPKFPYHSSYDNFEWVDRIGDPGFVYHGLLAQVVALLLLELSDKPVFPFDLAAYSRSLEKWIGDLEGWIESKGSKDESAFSLNPIKEGLDEVKAAVITFVKWELNWESTVMASNWFESSGLELQRCEYNNRMSEFETALLDLETGGGVSFYISLALSSQYFLL